MPDPRPMASSMRFGQYDEPPASESRARRSRLNRALRATADMPGGEPAETSTSTQSAPRRGFFLDILNRRRRQRSPDSEPRDTSSEELRRRRAKRRRLDTDLREPLKPIKYGYYGQVQPGKLRLDVVSCDGGEHHDPRHPSTYLGPQNVLRHDKSVYCSERASSGIVLRHADDTPFCLEKLHIVGPEHGFTAPVREGLVYVAMTLNDLSHYMDPPHHARQYGVHSPPYRSTRSLRSPPEQISLADALRDPEVGAALDASHHGDHASRADAFNDLSGGRYRDDENEHDSRRDDRESPCEGTGWEDAADVVLAEYGNLPVAFLSDEEPGPEESSSQEVLDFRLQRLQNMRRRFDVDGYDREERWSRLNEPYDGNDRPYDGSWGLRHIDAMMARSRMADSPQREDLGGDRPRNDENSNPRIPRSSSYYYPNAVRRDLPELHDDRSKDSNVTRARFRIERGKYKVAIKFDPPVSGRFILLKLWAHRSNVDIQSVIAKGYGGLRFFPAVEFR